MSDQVSSQSKLKGWFKTFLGTLGGLLSGAVVMYVTPLVDKAVKPAKPVANFKFEADRQGLQVRFENLSTGGQGWWDFGDGSPLEPVLPNQQLVYHTYSQAGEYTVKMSLRNLLGDENERSVTVKLSPSQSREPPKIQALEVTPISRGNYAPATFRLHSHVANAQMVVLELGDEQPLEVVTDLSGDLDKMVMFDKPGGYAIKLAAFNGDKYDKKTEVIKVLDTPAGTVTAMLTVAYRGVPVETTTRSDPFHHLCDAALQGNKLAFKRVKTASPGFIFQDVILQDKDGKQVRLGARTSLELDPAALGLSNVRGLVLSLSADRRMAYLHGELVRPPGAGQNPDAQPCLVLPAQFVQHRELPAEQKAVTVTTTLPIPAGGVSGSGLLQIPGPPGGWTKISRTVRLELREGSRTVWQGTTALPQRVLLTLQNHRCLLNATLVNDQVHLDLREDLQGGPRAAR